MTQVTRRDFLKTLGAGAALAALGGEAFAQGSPAAGAGAATAGKPNIVIIMADDMGFSDIGCYGSEIPTPNIDALAAGGVRFTQFYNTSRCCPTRASLLTGLYPHQAGIGDMNEDAGPQNPGYRGHLHDRCVTIAEVLKPAGYFTIHTGKWHVGGKPALWPRKRGFDRCYSVPQGGGFYFKPTPGRSIIENDTVLYDGNGPMPPEGWYSTDAWTDNAIKFVGEAVGQKKPFFLYLAHNAPHWPLQAPAAEIEKFKGKYMMGWDKLREARHQKQLAQGIMKQAWPLSGRNLQVRPWDALDEKAKEEQDLRMAIYAAVVAHMDQSVGRLIAALKQQGVFENTLILFLSDNGGCHEGGLEGSNTKPGAPGSAESHVSYGQSWANASNTPFRMFKHWVHEGGIATPLIAHWPAVIKRGQITDQVGHVIDLMATCADVGGAQYPKEFNGQPITPLEGQSLAPIFRTGKRAGHDAIFWEHEGNRAVRSGKWKLVAKANAPWELYDLENDRTELKNLAGDNPARVEELKTKWEAWAKRANVLPQPASVPGSGRKKGKGAGKKGGRKKMKAPEV